MVNKKQKIIAFITSCQFFIFLLIFIYPLSGIHASGILLENKYAKINNTDTGINSDTEPVLYVFNLNTMLIPFEFVAPAYRERAEELKSYITKGNDVILLQEVFSKKMQKDFIEGWYSANDLGKTDNLEIKKTQVYDSEALNQRPNNIKVSNESADFYVTGPKREGLKTLFGSGLLLLSRYPIIFSNVFCYKDREGSDVFASKGVIYAKIRTGKKDDEYIHFFTTHIQSHGYVATRQKNIEELFSFVYKILSDEINRKQYINPVIITGDFNVPANSKNKEISPEYIFLTENINLMCKNINSNFKNGTFYLKDLWVQKHPEDIGYTWIAKGEEEINGSPYGEIGNTIAIEKQGAERIDYIFYFEGGSNFKTENLNIDLFPPKPQKIYSFKNGDLESYTLSDHLGLTAEFGIIR